MSPKRKSKTYNNEAVAEIRSKRRSSSWLPNGPRVRIGVLAALAFVALGVYYAGQHVSLADSVELNVIADQGEATIGVAAQPNGVSPACGCMDPRFGKFPWSGLAIPSAYFGIGIAAEPSEGVEHHKWQLTAVQPPQDVINWFSTPEQTLMMRVTVRRDGRTVQLFHGRTTYLDLIASKPVEVEQDRRFPYAALLPAAGGSATIRSESPPRPGEGGSLTVESQAPERLHWATSEGGRYFHNPEMTQRGPMLDVIGKTRFRMDSAGDTQVYAAEHRIFGLRPADQLEITVRTPYSLRLIPSPAPRQWITDMRTIWSKQLLELGNPASETAHGPALTGRYLVTEPLPSYAMRLTGVGVPEQAAWSHFAARSEHKDTITSMLRGDPKAGDMITTEVYGLPPVSNRPEVGVFGHVTHFSSDSLHGELAIGSDTSAISRGQLLSVDSTEGLDAGNYQFTSLISAGEPTEPASIAGSAEVSINDSPRTKVAWLPWLAGAIGAAVIALALGGIVSWARRGSDA